MGDQMPLTDDISAFTNRQCFTHVVVSDQYAQAAVAQVLNDAFNVDNRDRVNPGKRFVEQNKFRIRSQCAGNFYTATFTPESDCPMLSRRCSM